MYLRDVTVQAWCGYKKEREFNYQTACVTSLYVRCLGKLDTGPFKKAIVELAPSEGNERPETLMDVVKVRAGFDFSEYWRLNVKARKILLLEVLQAGLMRLADQFNWAKSPLKRAHNCVVKHDLCNEGVLVGPVQGRGNGLKAEVYFSHEPDRLSLFVIVKDRANHLRTKRLIGEYPPHELFIRNAIDRIRWLASDTVEVAPKKGKSIILKVTA